MSQPVVSRWMCRFHVTACRVTLDVQVPCHSLSCHAGCAGSMSQPVVSRWMCRFHVTACRVTLDVQVPSHSLSCHAGCAGSMSQPVVSRWMCRFHVTACRVTLDGVFPRMPASRPCCLLRACWAAVYCRLMRSQIGFATSICT